MVSGYTTVQTVFTRIIPSCNVQLETFNEQIANLICNTINQIKSLYSRYYAEACKELRAPSPRLRAWATQLRRNVAMVASRWRHCADLTGPGIETQTSRTDSVRLATELTADMSIPSYSIRLCHSIQPFLQTQHLHQILRFLSVH